MGLLGLLWLVFALAGSLVFCKTLMSDFLATPALAGSEYRLMALTHRRLDKMKSFVDRMIRDNGVKATVTATTDRREALRAVTRRPKPWRQWQQIAYGS